MSILVILAVSGGVLSLAGLGYSRFLSRTWGEDPARRTPALRYDDGRDYVPTPTPVVFAHHFASIAGAGPIVGPVIAICYGWLPALVWVVVGGILIGAVHDYLATFMATREDGQSIATVGRRVLGAGPFVALILFLILALALVCATFLNLSAQALVSMVPFDRLDLATTQTLFRVVGEGGNARVVIGGIASTSVIVITAMAPLVGWLYIKRQVAVWKCSLLALVICAASIAIGLVHPVSVSQGAWRILLCGYVLVAAGLPVWLFLQSRDFINVHILYVGLLALVVTLLVVGARGGAPAAGEALPAWNLEAGTKALGWIWPGLFVTIACGAVSGFHSLCAGGTTCKQLTSERAVRRVGYWAMVLESTLAVSVLCVLMAGLTRDHYFGDVHPMLLGLKSAANPVLAFAMAVGGAVHRAFDAPIAVGALAGMVLLEGFLVTTLDTAVRLMRYLWEELWQVLFGLGRAGASPAGVREAGAHTGACGIPTELALEKADETLLSVRLPGWLERVMGHYMFNSGLAVAVTLWFAMSSGILSLWTLFATSNQLLAGFVLGLGSIWLLRRGKKIGSVLVPAVFMLAVTATSLIQLAGRFRPTGGASGNMTLFLADWVLMGLTVYLVYAGVREGVRLWRRAYVPVEA